MALLYVSGNVSVEGNSNAYRRFVEAVMIYESHKGELS